MNIPNLMRLIAGCIAVIAASSAFAGPIQGPEFITASTDIGTCNPAICLGLGEDINQIADGDVSDLNGFAGTDGVTGIITLDLIGNFDLESFSLWNDLNVKKEGVETFMLHFYDALDNFITSSTVLSAPVGQFAAQTYLFDSSILNVSRVDFDVLSLLTGGVGSRIEVREVAFTGEVSSVPEPSTLSLFAIGAISLRQAVSTLHFYFRYPGPTLGSRMLVGVHYGLLMNPERENEWFSKACSIPSEI